MTEKPNVEVQLLDQVGAVPVNLILYLVIFALPLAASHPQLLVGSAVNFFLLVAGQSLTKKKLWPVFVLPSLGAILHGVLFGPLTIFLFYMAPFIWLGNALLVYSYQYLTTKKLSKALSIILAAVAKTGWLYSMAWTLFKFKLVPALFLTAMGQMQLYTALLGGLAFLVISNKVLTTKK